MRPLSIHRIILAAAAATSLGVPAVHAQIVPLERIRVKDGIHTIVDGLYQGRDSLGYAVIAVGNDTTRIPMSGGYDVERFVKREHNGVGSFGRGVEVGGGIGLTLIGLSALFPPEHEPGVAMAGTIIVAVGSTLVGTVVGIVRATLDHDVWERVSFSSIPSDPPRSRY